MPSPALPTPTETTFSSSVITEVAYSSSGYGSNTSSISSVPSAPTSVGEVSSSGSVGFTTNGSQSAAIINLSLSAAPLASGLEKKDSKTAVKQAKKERLPRIQLKRIEGSPEGPVVECSFDTYKNSRITFKFGIDDDEPDEVSANMVRQTYVRCR